MPAQETDERKSKGLARTKNEGGERGRERERERERERDGAPISLRKLSNELFRALFSLLELQVRKKTCSEIAL